MQARDKAGLLRLTVRIGGGEVQPRLCFVSCARIRTAVLVTNKMCNRTAAATLVQHKEYTSPLKILSKRVPRPLPT
jgi:hypothetical protein